MSTTTQAPFQRRTKQLFTQPSKKSPGKPRSKDPRVEFIDALFDEAKQYRDGDLNMPDRWRNHRAWYLGSGSDMGGKGSLTYNNMIYSTIETMNANLTDGRPTFQFEPNTENDLPMTEFLNSAIPWVWDQHDMQQMYFRSVKANLLYGTWYWKVIHDPRYGAQGGVERVVEVPCWYIFPAPYARDPDNAPWIIEIYPRTVGEIKQDYGIDVEAEIGYGDFFPEVGEDLPGVPGVGAQTTVAGDHNSAIPIGDQPVGNVVDGLPDTFMGRGGGLVLQKELWIRDGSTIEDWAFEENDEGLPKLMKKFGLRFPKGRVMSSAGGHLLYDRENPYDDGRFPYVQFKDIPIPDFWYGLGEVHNLINLQLLHDDTHEIIKQIHLFTATGRLIVDKSTGLNDQRMGNRPGEIWFTDPGTWDRLKWLPGAAPSAEFYTYLNNLEQSFDQVTGNFDVTRGIAPSGVTAGKAFDTLAGAAGIRIKSRFNDIEPGLTRFAKLMASRVQQFWPAETSIRVTGRDRPDDQFSRFRIRPNDRDANYSVKVSNTANVDAQMQADFQKLILLAQSGLPFPPALLVEAANFSNEKKIKAVMAQMPPQPVPTGNGEKPKGK